jgi:hypothetical protein
LVAACVAGFWIFATFMARKAFGLRAQSSPVDGRTSCAIGWILSDLLELGIVDVGACENPLIVSTDRGI